MEYINAMELIARWKGLTDYSSAWENMRLFTDQRDEHTQDEIWFLEHSPVFTQGQNGKAQHLLNPGNIPVLHTDRGGQITYHGPGQLMIYTLIDIKRKKMGVRDLVNRLQQTLVDFLKDRAIPAIARIETPGVYINEQKIASIGLRIRRGASYHGIAFNVSLDLSPFECIHPCGFAELKMTKLETFTAAPALKSLSKLLLPYLQKNLGYTNAILIG